jgi:hypothetical protein
MVISKPKLSRLFLQKDVNMQEGPVEDSEFAVPEICPEKPEPGLSGRFHKHNGGLARMRSLLPNSYYGVLLRYPLRFHGIIEPQQKLCHEVPTKL